MMKHSECKTVKTVKKIQWVCPLCKKVHECYPEEKIYCNCQEKMGR